MGKKVKDIQVGVVLPVYHQEKAYIRECINSLETQQFRNFKLIIVLDGANEQTVKTTIEASQTLTISFQIIHRQQNRGIAFSLNEGFSHLKDCDYLTWVSSDNRQNPHFIHTLVKAIINAPKDVVLVYSLFHIINGRGKRISNETSYRTKKTKYMNRPKEQIVQTCFIGASFLFTRNSYLKAGGYDPNYEKVEDYEFWMRLLRVGEILFVPEFLMEYRLAGRFSYTTITSPDKIKMLSLKASIKNRRRNGDIPNVTVLLYSYNQEKNISRAIQSVLNQTNSNFHLMLIDDGSIDKTGSLMNKFQDSRIIPLLLTKSRGRKEALAIGHKYALGKYVIELDGDDTIEPKMLEIIVRELHQ